MAPAEAKYHTSSRMGAPRKATGSNLANAEDAPRPSMGSIGREFMGGPWESAGTCLGDCEVFQGVCGRVLGVCRDLSGRLQAFQRLCGRVLWEGPGSLPGLGLGDIGRGFVRQWEAHGSLPTNVAENWEYCQARENIYRTNMGTKNKSKWYEWLFELNRYTVPLYEQKKK
ncbi:hypothetical protein DFH09DRAFT_1097527 [Mycena vulgaris]|nr:hypothetical protein DFH09DRAFT_1097527 [Mycena vulgaris]